MKIFEKNMKQGIQGDVMFERVSADELPEGLVKAKREVDGQLVVAHSETGHNHSFDPDECGVTVLEDPNDPLVAYMKVETPSDLTHKRSYDTHETVSFTEGFYRINRQREHTPEGFRRAQD